MDIPKLPNDLMMYIMRISTKERWARHAKEANKNKALYSQHIKEFKNTIKTFQEGCDIDSWDDLFDDPKFSGLPSESVDQFLALTHEGGRCYDGAFPLKKQ